MNQRDIALGLDLAVTQSIPGKTDFLLNRTVFKIPTETKSFDIFFPNSSRIRCALTYQQCSSDTTKDIIGFNLSRDIDKFITLIAEKVKSKNKF